MQEIGINTHAAIVAVVYEAARCFGAPINGVSSVCENEEASKGVRNLEFRKAVTR